MTYLQSIFLGFVQGVAEFLPISSSGHLNLIQNLMHLEVPEFYDVLLHFGTLLAVFVFYRKDIIDMILEFFRGCRAIVKREPAGPEGTPPARRLVLLVIVGTLPLAVILPIKSKIEAAGGNNLFIGLMLLVTGALLFFSDRLPKGKKTERSASVVDALIVGCFQAVATLPGISRSGSTITGGMFRGFKRSFAVRFSFLLSLPAVLGATLLSLLDIIKEGTDLSQFPVYLVGTIVAAVVGYFSIRLLDLIAKKGKFGGFAYYCWAVGVITLISGFLL